MAEITLKQCPICKHKVGMFEYCKNSRMFLQIECGFCHLIMRSRYYEMYDENGRETALKFLVSGWNRRDG